jgi:YD repeat-containing protein
MMADNQPWRPSPVTIASGASYEPFGPLAALTYGNGLALSVTYNSGTGAVFSYGYNNDNRLVQASLGGATQAGYTLNYLGQRVIKAAAISGTTHFHYDRAGHLIAESDGSL